MGKCKPVWFTPKGGKKAHRDSFADGAKEKKHVLAGRAGFLRDCDRASFGVRDVASYSMRPPDEKCCKKCLRIEEAETAQGSKKP